MVYICLNAIRQAERLYFSLVIMWSIGTLLYSQNSRPVLVACSKTFYSFCLLLRVDVQGPDQNTADVAHGTRCCCCVASRRLCGLPLTLTKFTSCGGTDHNRPRPCRHMVPWSTPPSASNCSGTYIGLQPIIRI